MKKSIIFCVILLLIVSLLNGCGSKPSTTDTSISAVATTQAQSTTSSEGDTGSFRLSGIWDGDSTEGAIFKKIADEYVAKNPKFKYSYEYFVQNDMNEHLSVLAASDNLPDAFAMEANILVAPYSNAGLIMEFDKIYQLLGLNVKDYVNAGSLAACKLNTPDGKNWVWPLQCNSEGIWINQAVVKAADVKMPSKDWTFDEFYAFCDELQKAHVQPIAVGAKDQWPTTRWLVAYTQRALGAQAHMEASWNKIDFTSPEFIEAGNRLQMMFNKGYFGKGCTDLSMPDSVAMVANGQAAMQYNGSWEIGMLMQANEKCIDDIVLYPVPYLPNSKVSLEEQKATFNVNVGTGMSFTKAPIEKGTDLQFIKYLFENIGDKEAEYGAQPGHIIRHPDSITSKLGKLNIAVSDFVDSTKFVTQWWEAQMDANSTDNALTNSTLLLTGSMSSENYFKACKDAAIKQSSKK